MPNRRALRINSSALSTLRGGRIGHGGMGVGPRSDQLKAAFEATGSMEAALQITRNLSMHAVASGSMEANISGVGQLAANFAATGTLEAELAPVLPTSFALTQDTGANVLSAAQAKDANDLIWIKDLDNVNDHQLMDVVRGAAAAQYSNLSAVDGTYSAPSGNSIAWGWEEVAGLFAVDTYNGNNKVAQTVNHSLGVVPEWYIVKGDGTSYWGVYHHESSATPENNLTQLNTGAAIFNNAGLWWDHAPTSTTIGIGTATGVNTGTGPYLLYTFAGASGISKYGFYTGNGSTTGPVITGLGAAGRALIVRGTAAHDWYMQDSARGDQRLSPNTDAAEVSSDYFEFTSDGFNVISDNAEVNSNLQRYMYALWA